MGQRYKQDQHPFGRKPDYDWNRRETPEERVQKRKERITIASLITLLIAVLAILFTLLHQQLAQEVTDVSSVSPSSLSTIAPQTALPDGASGSESTASSTGTELPPTSAGLLVSFLDVGQGDSIFLRSPSGKTMLLDGGPDGSFSVIDAYLTKLDVVGLDVVVASHLHSDHISGLIPVIDTYPVGDIYFPPFDAESETYFNFMDAVNESQATVHRPYAEVNTLIPWDDAVEVRILSPYETVYSDFNDTSYIIRISYGNTAVLLTGDATELAEKLALKAQPNEYFRADVLKVAHHGSRDATFEAFLDAVSPAIAVISVGRNNDYGHPHDSLMDRLQERGITIYRTDEDGTITLLLDGTSVTVIK
ncbi:MAG TPA: ComEC/Rec2 family competence protein [Clostridia bacterium]|nr:ComEC/Rec2 family competence protein [Clostridia bacterium]